MSCDIIPTFFLIRFHFGQGQKSVLVLKKPRKKVPKKSNQFVRLFARHEQWRLKKGNVAPQFWKWLV